MNAKGGEGGGGEKESGTPEAKALLGVLLLAQLGRRVHDTDVELAGAVDDLSAHLLADRSSDHGGVGGVAHQEKLKVL